MSSFLTKETWVFTLLISVIWLQIFFIIATCYEMSKGGSAGLALGLFAVVGLWVAVACFAQLLYMNQKARKKYPSTVFLLLLVSLIPTIGIVFNPFVAMSGASLGASLATIFIPLVIGIPILWILIAFQRSLNKPSKTKQR